MKDKENLKERENNMLALPRRDLELLEYLRTLEKRLLAEHKKEEEGVIK